MSRLLRLLMVIIGGLCLPSYAETPVTPQSDAELADLFASFCLKSFPDQSALDRLGRSKAATAMTPAEVAMFLHADPGHGWLFKSPTTRYVITIEDPPYRACAVRTMTPAGLSGVPNYIASIKAYVAERNGQLANRPPVKQTTPSGADLSAYSQQMSDPTGKPTDLFSVILTNYHGRIPDFWRPDFGQGVGVEVRMVHQLVLGQ